VPLTPTYAIAAPFGNDTAVIETGHHQRCQIAAAHIKTIVDHTHDGVITLQRPFFIRIPQAAYFFIRGQRFLYEIGFGEWA
jgi:hypothetical protein